MKEQVISAAINIVCGFAVAIIYDWFRARSGAASVSSRPAGNLPEGFRGPVGPPAAARSGGLLRGLLILIVLAAAGFAAAVVVHRLGLGLARPPLETLIRHGAIIATSMLVFVLLLGRLRR